MATKTKKKPTKKALPYIYTVPDRALDYFMNTDEGELGTFLNTSIEIKKGHSAEALAEAKKKLVEVADAEIAKHNYGPQGYASELRVRAREDVDDHVLIEQKNTIIISDLSISRHQIDEYNKAIVALVKEFGAPGSVCQISVREHEAGGHDEWTNSYCWLVGGAKAIKQILAKVKKQAVKDLTQTVKDLTTEEDEEEEE